MDLSLTLKSICEKFGLKTQLLNLSAFLSLCLSNLATLCLSLQTIFSHTHTNTHTFPHTESHTSPASVTNLNDKCLKTGGCWKKNKRPEDDSDSQPGGDIIEACNHRLLFPEFSGVQGPGSMWGGVRGKLGGR